jgi:NAD(P)-dependent dehydrogenase (short-subunit alcohol dehydrogenase family)
MFDFGGQVVIVTGAAGNLGRALAEAFGNAGAHLVLVDYKPGRLAELYPRWQESAQHMLAPLVDVAQPEQVQAMVQRAVGRFGRVDVLVNAAGGYRGGQPFAETPIEQWAETLDLNARTAAVACRAVLPVMLEQGRGRIVNLGAKSGVQGVGKQAAYSGAKSAVLRLTESLAAEVKAAGINVNCVLPSTIDSPENRAAMPKADPARWVTPESMAGVILFLASDWARDIHGALLPVYGRA